MLPPACVPCEVIAFAGRAPREGMQAGKAYGLVHPSPSGFDGSNPSLPANTEQDPSGKGGGLLSR